MPRAEVITSGCLHRLTDDGVCAECDTDRLPLAWGCPLCQWARGRQVDPEPGTRMFYLATACGNHARPEDGD